MTIRRNFATGLALLALVALGCRHPANRTAGRIVPATTQSSTSAFEDNSLGLRFHFPASWHPVKDDTILTLVPTDEATIGHRVLVIDNPDLPPHLPGLIPMGLVEAGFVSDVKSRCTEVTVSRAKPMATIDGTTATWLTGAGRRKDTGQAMVLNAVLMVHGDAVYVIDAECDPAFADPSTAAFKTVVGSLQWMR